MKRKRSSEDVKNTDDKEKEKGKAQEPPQHEVKREKLSDSKDDKGKEKIKKEENEDEPGGLSIAEEAAAHRQAPPEGTSCPYLDTIDRTLLDFDFEKVCSVSSVNVNIYCCLVCGRYFQGRGRSSHAYFHSLAADHHVFINLHNEKVYCLPDGYEVRDPSLEDIKYVLNPRYTPQQVAQLDSSRAYSSALDGTQYLPGNVGLNNIKNNDFINVVIQCLIHVVPLRDFFMIEENYSKCKSHLVKTFAEFVRKVWNPRNFKAHVSPHELLQAITLASERKFMIGVQADPLDFLLWFLNTLHKDLGGTHRPGSSIIHKTFQGFVKVTTDTAALKEKGQEMEVEGEERIIVKESPFMFLSLDIPPPPLYKEDVDKNVIPQVPLFTCLAKYDGVTETPDPVRRESKRYVITDPPAYLIFHLKRFTKNNWFTEKNPTIVNFPVKNLELRPYTTVTDPNVSTKYNLLGNICHDGQSGQGTYRAHVLAKGKEQWLEVQDLMVKETLPQLISLSEAYLQIYELKPA